MFSKNRFIVFLTITALILLTTSSIAAAIPASAISNELRATIEVLPGSTAAVFDSQTMTLEPGYVQAGNYNYRSTVYDWLSAHVTSVSVEGAAIDAAEAEFIEFQNGPSSNVLWQGYTISAIDGAAITSDGKIGDNLNITTPASATVTITALRYQDTVYQLTQAVELSLQINPYFTGNVEEINPAQAAVSVADASLDITGLTSGGSPFSLPAGATIYRLFQPVTGITPEGAGLSQIYLTGENEIMADQTCKVNKRWPSGQHDIYIVNGITVYHLALRLDHLSHDAANAISYLKAANTELVTNAVRLSWGQGLGEVPAQSITCGQVHNLPVQVWATEPLAVKLVAIWTGGTATHEADLVSGTNPEIEFPITFNQTGTFDLSVYAELR